MTGNRTVMSLYDRPMWGSIRARRMALQKCRSCGRFRYPPAPICPTCLAMEYDWQELAGTGTILSWVIFHRQYLESFPPPYNVVAVALTEGPIFISNLIGPEPEGSWIGRAVELGYAEDVAGEVIPKVQLTQPPTTIIMAPAVRPGTSSPLDTSRPGSP
ncbi:MAG: Zn-ribbon domain-containing OB-fold protein [Bradyrhizobium sp.]